MLKPFDKIFLFIVLIPALCFGQVTGPAPGYQMIMMNNPAYSGIEGDGTLRISYLNIYPGNNYNLHSVYFSYDSFFPALHGGAGFYLTDDYLGGIVDDLRGGLSYSYFLQAGKDLFINAGLSASILHRGLNFRNAVLPDQIDPLGGVTLPSSEVLTNSGETVFDICTGFIFLSGKFSGGFSINHLAEPDLSGTGIANQKIKRELLLNLSADFEINTEHNLLLRPVTFFDLQKSEINAGGGAVLESNYFSVNALLMGNKGKNLNMQTGFSINTGKVIVFYNYQFNIASGNTLLPFSLLHQAGLAISLNNVDKKNIIKTIKFPKL
jgi:type IX secretion system PorP/SprF family membrane protein